MATTAFRDSFLGFINGSPSPFHAVSLCVNRLVSAGYTQLHENATWKLKPNGKYFFTRNQSCLFAFAVGGKYTAQGGINIIGTHTDSPCLKVKPVSHIPDSYGFVEVGVQTYGGGLWHTWFDRDLKIAGRVVVKTGEGDFQPKLVHVDRPILRVSNLAIHLDRGVNDAFKFNKQTHLQPLLCTAAKAELNKEGGVSSDDKKEKPTHHSVLLGLLTKELGCKPEDIQDFELCLADHQPATVGGALDEFIFAPRLDNLHSTFCAVEGLIDAGNLADESRVRMIALFDNEEVGSQSNHGANGNIMEHTIARIAKGVEGTTVPNDVVEVVMRNSFLISADMAHACHPNYAEKHDGAHRPMLHKGVVLKHNANQRYATTAVTSFLIKQVAAECNVPIQEFVVRNDSPCGSTIGPMLSARGLRTVDLGAAQLSMHSIREMCGTDDLDHTANLMRGFFEKFTTIDEKVQMD